MTAPGCRSAAPVTDGCGRCWRVSKPPHYNPPLVVAPKLTPSWMLHVTAWLVLPVTCAMKPVVSPWCIVGARGDTLTPSVGCAEHVNRRPPLTWKRQLLRLVVVIEIGIRKELFVACVFRHRARCKVATHSVTVVGVASDFIPEVL